MKWKDKLSIKRSVYGHLVLAIIVIGLGSLPGCNTLADRVNPVGEGDIPVGRTIGNRGPVLLTIKACDGSVTTATSNEVGLFYVPSQPYGQASVSLTPSNPVEDEVEFSIELGPSQKFVFLAEARPAKGTGQVERIDIKLPGSSGQLKVGQTVPIVVKVFGSVPGNIKPTVWIDGGVAEVGPGIVLRATAPGTGVIRAELYGVSNWLYFSVQ